MNEKTMTLEELCQYAQEGKEKTEKERLSKKAQRKQACYEIIEKIIDRLVADKGDAVKVWEIGKLCFNINVVSYEVTVAITLDDIKAVIDLIPALEAEIVSVEGTYKRSLKVWFSETNVQLKIPEGLRSEDK